MVQPRRRGANSGPRGSWRGSSWAAGSGLDSGPRRALDLRLDDGDGVALAEDIRAEDGRRDLPILVLSADTTPDDAKRAREAGCNGFLTKPVGSRMLLARISELIGAVERAGSSDSSPAA